LKIPLPSRQLARIVRSLNAPGRSRLGQTGEHKNDDQEATEAHYHPKSASIALRANGAVLTLLALRTPHGARTTVTRRQPNEEPARGMTEQHKSFDAAKVRLDALAKDAEKQGWVRGRFQASTKPDGFSTLPAVPKPEAAHGS
jgi:hypothetical protein